MIWKLVRIYKLIVPICLSWTWHIINGCMKILQITPFFPPDKGGIAVHVFNLFKHFNQKFSVSVVAPKRLSNTGFEEDGILVKRINSFYLPGWPYPTLRSMSVPVDFGQGLRSLIREGKFDIIHVHGHHYPISWIAISAAYKIGVPVVLTLHGTYALNPFVKGGKTTIEDWLNKKFFPRILNKTTSIIGLTKVLTKYGMMIGGESPKYFTIPNGIDTNVYARSLGSKGEYRIKYGLTSDAVIILFRGRFEHVKGILEFVKACKLLISELGKKVEVLIVGGGTLEDKVRAIANSTKGVHLFGWQKEDAIHELYIASDIFVLPSRFEALPITIIEAMNAGLHVVYTEVGGVPDILKGYEKKTPLSDTSSDQIRRVLISIIQSSSFDGTGNNSSIEYAKTFDWQNIISQIHEVYLKSNAFLY